jgi:hypothetical protein
MMAKILWWYMPINQITKHKPNIVFVKGNALLFFGQFHHFNVNFMVAHSLWLLTINHSIF